jgi:hypothetical protein
VTPARSSFASCVGALVGTVIGSSGCGGTLDAGRDVPHGKLPVDERNPVIIDNDNSTDNWMGEYAVLLANSGANPIVGFIASASPYYSNATANATGFGKLVAAARASGLQIHPDVTTSAGVPLVRPDDGVVDHTIANNAAGAQLIVRLSRQFATPVRPLVVLSGVPLTNLADAYLIDHSVVDRVVAVAALGELGSPTATMNGPNGDLDAWSDWIVAQKYRYVQVSAYYDQTGDVTSDDLTRMPNNALGSWMKDKQPKLYTIPQASDQIAALAVALPAFASGVQRASPDTSVAFDDKQGPPLKADDAGNVWVVTKIDAPLAATRLWQMLGDPKTFAR